MNKPPLLLVIGVVVIAVLATHRYINKRREDAANAVSVPRTMLVEVTAKREFPAPNRRSRQREVIAGEEMAYEVYFKPRIGSGEMKFQLPEKTYHQIDKGSQGTLTVQGTRFISYVPEGLIQTEQGK